MNSALAAEGCLPLQIALFYPLDGPHGPGLLGVALRERALWFFCRREDQYEEKGKDDDDNNFQGPVT
jgi:hypothetical protein